MVTVSQEATESETLIPDLLKMGTSIVRINCAHGDPSVWIDIIRRVKRSSQMLEKPRKVLMDLARVLEISPKKHASGIVIFLSQVWLS